jgi:hypothetical protein
MPEHNDEIMAALPTETPLEQLDRLKKERTKLRGKEAKYNLSDEEEARLKTVEAEIESLEKGLEGQGKTKDIEGAEKT